MAKEIEYNKEDSISENIELVELENVVGGNNEFGIEAGVNSGGSKPTLKYPWNVAGVNSGGSKPTLKYQEGGDSDD